MAKKKEIVEEVIEDKTEVGIVETENKEGTEGSGSVEEEIAEVTLLEQMIQIENEHDMFVENRLLPTLEELTKELNYIKSKKKTIYATSFGTKEHTQNTSEVMRARVNPKTPSGKRREFERKLEEFTNKVARFAR